MKKLRYFLFAVSCLGETQSLLAQPVPRINVVEHFTNTFCSICAGRNPGLYNNLTAFPDVLHIAYYPSAPYPACPFNQMNKADNDARTNYYGVYGSTPRLVLNGSPIPANASYTDPALFQNIQGQMSDYAMHVQVSRSSSTTAEATIIVKKVAQNAISNLLLYVVVAEDTVQFNANNGETIHYDKFNKSLTGTAPMSLSGLLFGDSVVKTFSFSTGGNWTASRVTAILQDDMKNGLQAARSARIPPAMKVVPTSVAAVPLLYPNPAYSMLYFPLLNKGYHNYCIVNALGQAAQRGIAYDPAVPISIASLESGFYIITIGEGTNMQRGTFVKQ